MAKKATRKRIRVEDPAVEATGAATATQSPPAEDTKADPKVTVEERQYVGPWGKEWICEVQNLEHPGADGVIWTVTLNSDQRNFLNGREVQLSDGHLEVLKNAVIRDEVPISEESAYYWNKQVAEKHNPGMHYEIIAGIPTMVRKVRRYMAAKIRPATSAPLGHGAVQTEE